MQQPELGRQLAALRKTNNLTQEELAERSHVSVRTIQRIEAEDVLPRVTTVKILFAALGADYSALTKSLNNQKAENMETILKGPSAVPTVNRNAVLIAALAGAVYLISEIILATMDITWITGRGSWSTEMNWLYTGLTAVMVISYGLFNYGFIVLGQVFENRSLRVVSCMLIVSNVAFGILNVLSLSPEQAEIYWFPYIAAAVLFGTLYIGFGMSLLKLQDGMGELSRIAGILEIIVGCTLVIVVLFFVSFVMMIPAVLIEIILLYKAYEYLSKSKG